MAENQKFLCVYDYGMGGVWGYVLAPSAEAIRERFPELWVFIEEPAWFSDAELEGLEIEDLEEPQRLGLLGAMLAQRENDQREVDQ